MKAIPILLVAIFIGLGSMSQTLYFDWAQKTGGSSNDEAGSLLINRNGDLVNMGVFNGYVDFDPGPGTFFLNSNGPNVYVRKMTGDGNLIWAKQLMGEWIYGYDIEMDAQENIYITGQFTGSIDADPGPATFMLTQPPIQAGISGYLIKLDHDGNFIWAKQFDGENPYIAIEVDSGGNIYGAGMFRETTDFDPGPGTQILTAPGSHDMVSCKFNTNGELQWLRQTGAAGLDQFTDLAIDAEGNPMLWVYIQERWILTMAPEFLISPLLLLMELIMPWLKPIPMAILSGQKKLALMLFLIK